MRQQDRFQVRLRTEAPGKKARALKICAVSLLALALSLGTFAADTRAEGKKKDEIPFDDARIIIETNATDCDSGIQVTLDGEPWKRVSIENPKGRTILDVKLKGSLRRFGLTEQFNESNEPVMDELVGASDDCDEQDVEFTLEKFFRLFPQGLYEFEGKTIEGDELESKAWLSHVIPAGPEITSPEEDEMVDPDDTVIRWNEVTDVIATDPVVVKGDVDIVGYQVIVEEDVDSPAVFSVDLPASQTSVTVPTEFLESGKEYKVEVLAIDRSGNQTITELGFQTQP